MLATATIPQASPGREKFALELFPLNQSPEEYAARKGHLWASFSFDAYAFENLKLNVWISRFGDIYAGRDGAPSIAELRATHLSAEECARIEEGHRESQPIGHYPSVIFTSFTLRPGAAASRYEIDSAKRHRSGVDFFHVLLEQRIADLSTRLGPENTLQLEWTDAQGACAWATFIRDGVPLTTSVLVCGTDASADTSALIGFERHVADMYQLWNCPLDSLGPPVRERPAIITAILPSVVANRESMEIMKLIGAMETDLAAAYFEQRQPPRTPVTKKPWWRRLL